jgi:nucleotide-binding universal stress UspA family protein
MSLVTTAMTPPLLRAALRHVTPDEEESMRLLQEEQQAGSFLGKIRRILLPTAGGPHATLAARLINMMDWHNQVEVTTLWVNAPGTVGTSASAFKAADDELTQERVTAVRKSVTSQTAEDGILQEAERGYDLVVAGCGSGSIAGETVFGTLTDRLAVNSSVPFLAVRSPERVRDWGLENIILPTSGVIHSEQAAEFAVKVAHSAGAPASLSFMSWKRPAKASSGCPTRGARARKLPGRSPRTSARSRSHSESFRRSS